MMNCFCYHKINYFMENRVYRILFLLTGLAFSINSAPYRTMPLQSLPGDKQSKQNSDDAVSTKNQDTLSGGYIGLTTMIAHMNTKIDHNSLGGSGAFGGFTIGGGKKVRKAYLAGELEVNYGSVLATKESYGKVAGSIDIGAALRIGYATQNKLIPYLKLGFGWTDYKLKTNGQKQKFNTAYFAPGLGFEMPILTSSLLRLEAAYSMNFGNKALNGHSFQSRPSRIILKAGGYTRF
jgi:hypothetical protein